MVAKATALVAAARAALLAAEAAAAVAEAAEAPVGGHDERGRAPLTQAASARAQRAWRQFVQNVFGIRHLQRLFKNIGDRLQDYPASLREALSRHVGGTRAGLLRGQ